MLLLPVVITFRWSCNGWEKTLDTRHRCFLFLPLLLLLLVPEWFFDLGIAASAVFLFGNDIHNTKLDVRKTQRHQASKVGPVNVLGALPTIHLLAPVGDSLRASQRQSRAERADTVPGWNRYSIAIAWIHFSVEDRISRLHAVTHIAFPPVLAIRVHFVVECVKDVDLRARDLVDAVHMRLEHGAVVVVVFHGTEHKHVRVDHLMQQGVDEIAPRSKLEQRFTAEMHCAAQKY